MKKINSIHYGGKILLAGILFGIFIPLVLVALSKIWNSNILQVMLKISFVLGMLILVLFFIHLGIEFYQDKKIDRYYSSHGKRKVFIADDKYECGMCGNRQVQETDIFCKLCGVQFENESDKTPQEILEER